MSKIIWICSKNGFKENTKEKLQGIISFITPDNITPNQPEIKIGQQIAYGILNPKGNIKYGENSICLGVIFGDYSNWYHPLNKIPDGSFAIFRDDEKYSEIISDAAGSRTIWYYQDDEQLIAATSQFAIIKYLGFFEFNPDVIPWMLTTGTLGPDLSWDKKIKKLPPDTSIILDKKTWKLKLNTDPIIFKAEKKSKDKLALELEKKLNETILDINLESIKWILPLSGGYDSRGLLYLLKNNKINPIKTITWGLPESIKDLNSDSYVAMNLAKKLNVDNEFHPTSFSAEPIETIFKRFILNGEGRIDHFGGYLDGFKIWKKIHDNNIDLVIRGDENFGWHNVNTKKDVLTSLGIKFFLEFNNFNRIGLKLNFKQSLPSHLQIRSKESLSQWRDRLYTEYRIQCMISALGDLKLSYVEQISPLLSKKVLNHVKLQPDKIRTERFLWKEIVNSFKPNVPFATKDSISKNENFTKSEIFVTFLSKKIEENLDNQIFDKEFLYQIIKNLELNKSDLSHIKKYNLKSVLKQIIPNKIYSILKERNFTKTKLDNNILAFRIVMLLSVLELFEIKNSKN